MKRSDGCLVDSYRFSAAAEVCYTHKYFNNSLHVPPSQPLREGEAQQGTQSACGNACGGEWSIRQPRVMNTEASERSNMSMTWVLAASLTSPVSAMSVFM
ncbi:hypothetical protein E2C01_038615 [Portunus trituberculatus]|uniref:Uncharacterized protein n=1 Tax=Portunus trituberculatus TaxID=210409 RepID=A0A5B7FIG9_PORTR|nr:hypothetical protein [Portunus trituberculatus]